WRARSAAASASAGERLSRDKTAELRAYDHTLVLARPGAARTLGRAGGVRIVRALPIWRLPSGAALRVLPGLMRRGLVRTVEPDQPVHSEGHLDGGDPLIPSEWWIPFVGADRAEPP